MVHLDVMTLLHWQSSSLPTITSASSFEHQNPSIVWGKLPFISVKALLMNIPNSLASNWHEKDLGHLGLYCFLGFWKLMTGRSTQTSTIPSRKGDVFPIKWLC